MEEPVEKHRVSWKVPELTGDTVHAQTYDSKAEAERQAADIRGYEGVTDVTIEPESCIVDEAPSADPGARLDL